MTEPAAGLQVRLRPLEAGDAAFLRVLEADRLGIGHDDPLAGLQARARQQGYRSRCPDAADRLVLVGHEPAGRIMVAVQPAVHHVVDVALLRSHRGRGIGTALMHDVQAEAARVGVPVELAVLAGAPRVVGWYERLGFRTAGTDGVHVHMVWEPGRG